MFFRAIFLLLAFSSAQASYFEETMIGDAYGWGAECTPVGELRTVRPNMLVGATFVGDTLDTNFWTATLSDGTVTQGNNKLVLSSVTDNGSAIVQSVARGRYVGGSANRYLAQIELGDADGGAVNVRKWGAFDGTDGAYFKFAGTTLYACTMKGGVETAVASSSWNASTTVPTVTDVQSYEIYWTNTKVYFVIAGVLKHTASFPDDTWTDNTNLPIRMSSITTHAGDAYTLTVRAATIYRLGEAQTQPRSYYHALGQTTGRPAYVTLKRGMGQIHRVLISGAVDTSVVTLYDNVIGSGTVLWSATFGAQQTLPVSLDFGNMVFQTGLTLTVTNANASVVVIYE